MLIVQGGRDIQVPRADGEALRKAQPGATYAYLSDMNHVLKAVSSDDRMANLAAYGDASLPVSPALVDAIASFVTAQDTTSPARTSKGR